MEEEPERGSRLHFVKFETKYIESCLDFIQKNILEHGSEIENKVIKATGNIVIIHCSLYLKIIIMNYLFSSFPWNDFNLLNSKSAKLLYLHTFRMDRLMVGWLDG